MTTQTARDSRRLEVSFVLCMVTPLAIGVLLNALVRPGLATMLGGERHASGAGVRSQDVWWTFEPAVRQEHPILTSFLTASDGYVGIWILASTAALLTARWLIVRYRAKRVQGDPSGSPASDR